MRKNRTYHLAELLYKSVKSVVSKTQGGLYIYTMQLPCICTYVWLVVTEICMVSVTSRNVPKFGTEGRCFMNKVVLVVIALIFLASRALDKLLVRLNTQHPGVKFYYDEQEHRVYASGYFSNTMSPERLMEKVHEVSDCFRQK